MSDNYKCEVCEREFNDEEFEHTNDKNKCIFHCKKDNWECNNRKEDNIFFWRTFKDYIESIKSNLTEKEKFNLFDYFEFPKLDDRKIFKNYIFKNELVFNNSCIFHGSILFLNTVFEKEVYINGIDIKGYLKFIKCKFSDKVTINEVKKNNLYVNFRFSTFEKKVELKDNLCCDIILENTKFNKLCDFYNSTFEKTDFYKTDFKDISVFTECTFNEKVNFTHTTFEKLAIFRNTKFKETVDLKDTIIKDRANFLEMEANVENRETARIIKDSFEQQNNIIEANKYYAIEMQKREEELQKDIKKGKNFFDWMVFKIHGLSSKHSQSWIWPLIWILNISFLYNIKEIFYWNGNIEYFLIFIIAFIPLLVYLQEEINIVLILDERINNILTFLSILSLMIIYFNLFDLSYLISLDNLSNSINPFSIMTSADKLTFTELLFKVIIAFLIYQFIISIRQNTRRK